MSSNPLKRPKLFLSMVFAVFLLTLPAFGGVVFEIETTDHRNHTPTTTTQKIYAEGSNLKMSIPNSSGGPDEAIYQGGARRQMVVVDHGEKTFMTMDEETMAKIGGQVNDAMRQMEEALENVPADQRAMVEKMLKERMPPQAAGGAERPRATLKKTGDRATKNGFPCVKYEVIRDDRMIREHWVTDWSNVEGGQDVAAAFKDMASFFSKLMDSMPQMGQGPVDDAFFTDFEDMNGFPVLTRGFGADGKLENESALRSATRRTLDPADFEPPAGYKRQQMLPSE